MEIFPLGYIPVIAAAIANMVIGFLWYGPLFGKKWMKLSGHTGNKNANMPLTYILALVGSLVMAWVLSHSLVFAAAYLETSGPSAGLQAGFWNWLGFIAPVTMGVVLWEGKPWTLWSINAGYYLAALLVEGVILSYWM